MRFSAAASPLWAWLQLGQGIADQTSGGLVYLLEMSPPAITLHTSDPCHQNWILSTTTIYTIWEENIREGEYYSNGFHGESDEDFNNFLLHHQRIIVRHQCILWKPFCKMFEEKSWIYRRTTGGEKKGASQLEYLSPVVTSWQQLLLQKLGILHQPLEFCCCGCWTPECIFDSNKKIVHF